MKHRIDRLIAQLTADKKKLGVMLCAIAIGLLLWGRLLLQGVPRTATADDPNKTAQADGATPKDAGKVRKSERPKPVVYVDLPDGPGRDLFGFYPNRYNPTYPGGGGDSSAKSAQVTPDVDHRVEAVRQEASELVLESIVTGTRPRAYISGRLVAPGEEVEGFTLVKVTDRHVILTKYGLFIRLRM